MSHVDAVIDEEALDEEAPRSEDAPLQAGHAPLQAEPVAEPLATTPEAERFSSC